MGKIKQLSKEVINQIAAGEIVQRNGHHNLVLNPFGVCQTLNTPEKSENNISIAQIKDHRMQ